MSDGENGKPPERKSRDVQFKDLTPEQKAAFGKSVLGLDRAIKEISGASESNHMVKPVLDALSRPRQPWWQRVFPRN